WGDTRRRSGVRSSGCLPLGRALGAPVGAEVGEGALPAELASDPRQRLLPLVHGRGRHGHLLDSLHASLVRLCTSTGVLTLRVSTRRVGAVKISDGGHSE